MRTRRLPWFTGGVGACALVVVAGTAQGQEPDAAGRSAASTATRAASLSSGDRELARYLTLLENLDVLEDLELLEVLPILKERDRER